MRSDLDFFESVLLEAGEPSMADLQALAKQKGWDVSRVGDDFRLDDKKNKKWRNYGRISQAYDFLKQYDPNPKAAEPAKTDAAPAKQKARSPEELLPLIRSIVGQVEVSGNGTSRDIYHVLLDRFRRHDSGGGPNGDDWLDDREIESDRRMGEKKHEHVRKQIDDILTKYGYKPTASLYLGEKGHFTLEFTFQKKK